MFLLRAAHVRRNGLRRPAGFQFHAAADPSASPGPHFVIVQREIVRFQCPGLPCDGDGDDGGDGDAGDDTGGDDDDDVEQAACVRSVILPARHRRRSAVPQHSERGRAILRRTQRALRPPDWERLVQRPVQHPLMLELQPRPAILRFSCPYRFPPHAKAEAARKGAPCHNGFVTLLSDGRMVKIAHLANEGRVGDREQSRRKSPRSGSGPSNCSIRAICSEQFCSDTAGQLS
jgi:hypothetical protein